MARSRVMALTILGVPSVTACGSNVNHLTSPSDSPAGQSTQQTFVGQLEPPPKGTVSSNAAACSILTASMAKSFLGLAVDKPRGEVLSDGQGSECQYLPQTFRADNVALTIYSKMSMAEFLDHPWERSDIVRMVTHWLATSNRGLEFRPGWPDRRSARGECLVTRLHG